MIETMNAKEEISCMVKKSFLSMFPPAWMNARRNYDRMHTPVAFMHAPRTDVKNAKEQEERRRFLNFMDWMRINASNPESRRKFSITPSAIRDADYEFRSRYGKDSIPNSYFEGTLKNLNMKGGF